MIRGTVNRQRRSSHFTDNPSEVRKQAHLNINERRSFVLKMTCVRSSVKV
jgi:hypothetical protein